MRLQKQLLVWEIKRYVLCVLLMKRIELFKGCRSAVVIECIPRTGVPAKVRQIEEVAGVSSVHEDLGLLGKYFSTSLAKKSRCRLEICLVVSGRGRGSSEEKYVGLS